MATMAWELDPFSATQVAELSPEWRKRALDEVQEKEGWRQRDVEALREMVTNEPSLSCPTDDAFLLKFLRAQKFDYERALTMLKRYFLMRQRCPQNFTKALPSLAKDVLLNHTQQTVLDHRDAKGRRVFLFRAGVWDPVAVPPGDVFAANFLCLEMMAREAKTQVAGIVVVVDMAGLSFNHIMNISSEYVKSVASIIQSTFPLRFREIHIINESYLFGIVFALIKPFLSDTIKSRIQFHGSNLTQLHETLKPSILPVEFGGNLGTMSNTSLVGAMLECEDYFRDLCSYGFTQGGFSPETEMLATPHPFSGYCLAQDN